MAAHQSISIIIPALNEGPRLAAAVQIAREVTARVFDDYELIIINDGSTDETAAVADGLAAEDAHITVVHNESPRNLGGAFKQGLALASMEFVTAYQGKGGTPADQVEKIWRRVGEADIVVPYIENMCDRPPIRRAISRTFTALVNGLFGLRLRYHMHFVVYRRAALASIALRTDSYAFQAEALVKLIRGGRSYIEVPVRDAFTDEGPSRSYRLRNLWGVASFLVRTLWDVHIRRVGSSTGTPLAGAAARQCVQEHLGQPLEALEAFPQYINLDPVDQCNARCIMCGVPRANRRGERMSQEMFDRIVAELAGHADWIQRVGLNVNCEPLLDDDLAAKVAALKAAGIRKTFISTNASLLTPGRSRELLEAGLDQVYASIDSLDKATFESIRRGLDFATVCNNVRELIALRDAMRPETTVRIVMVQVDANAGESEAFVRHWQQQLRSSDEVVVDRAYDWSDRAADGPERSAVNISPCIALWSTVDICATGKVHLCCFDVHGQILLGDLADQSIEEIWHSRALGDMRRAHLSGRRSAQRPCDGCGVWDSGKRLRRASGGSLTDE